MMNNLHLLSFWILTRAPFSPSYLSSVPPSWLRGRSGTSWHKSSSHRKAAWGLAPTPRASQRWAALHRDWLRTISRAGSEGSQTLLTRRGPPPPPSPAWRTDTDRQTYAWTNRQTDGRITGERHTDPAIDRERYKEGGSTPDSQSERSAI